MDLGPSLVSVHSPFPRFCHFHTPWEQDQKGGEQGAGSCLCLVPALIMGVGMTLSLIQQLLLQFVDWMFVPPSGSFVEVLPAPTPTVVSFRGGRILGRSLGLDEVLRVGLPRIGWVSIINRMKDLFPLSKSTVRKQPTSQEASPGTNTPGSRCVSFGSQTSASWMMKKKLFLNGLSILSIFKNKFGFIYETYWHATLC